MRRTPASGVGVLTHSTEEDLSGGEEEVNEMVNEIQPGHRTFSSGAKFLLQLCYEDPFTRSFAPTQLLPLIMALGQLLPRSTQYQILPDLWFSSTGVAPALLSIPTFWPPYVVLEAKDSCLAILYLGTYMVLDQCHLEWDSAAIISYCPGNQEKREVAKLAGHLDITTQLKTHTNKTAIFQRKKKK